MHIIQQETERVQRHRIGYFSMLLCQIVDGRDLKVYFGSQLEGTWPTGQKCEQQECEAVTYAIVKERDG